MEKGANTVQANTMTISFLGGFCMEMGGNILTDEINRSKKLWNVLAYLIYNRERHISQNELIELFWQEDNSSNPANALKTLLFRARAVLEPIFGPEPSLIVSQRGAYSWNHEILCETDIDQFAEMCRQAQLREKSADERISLYRGAVEFYRGDFLPRLADQLWVVPISARYHMMYLDTVKALSALLESNGNYKEMSELCIRGSEMDPLDEELHILIVRAYIRQGKEAAALAHYEKATDLLYRNLGIRPSEELRALYAEIMKTEHDMEIDLEAIQKAMKETASRDGAFLCDYGFFKEAYRLEARRCVRNGSCVHVVLITVSLPDGGVPPLKVLNATMDQLKEVLISSLRKGDVVSKYSGAQYVVLLPSANFEDSTTVMERVESAFRQQHHHSFLKITYKIRELEID